MSLSGMEVEAILNLADRMTVQAARLDEILGSVGHLVAIAEGNWDGPSMNQFRIRWETQFRGTGLAAASDLRVLGDIARRNAYAQRETSSTLGSGVVGSVPGSFSMRSFDSGGSLGSALDSNPHNAGDPYAWIKNGASWLGHTAEQGIGWAGNEVQQGSQWVGSEVQSGTQWVGDRVNDVAGFIAPRIDATMAGLNRYMGAESILASEFTRMFTEGRVPQTSELAAAGVLVAGTGVGLMANAFGGTDYKLFDPGKPSAGQPKVITSELKVDGKRVAGISDYSSLTAATMSAYDDQGIRVDQIIGSDGVSRYVVSIPGTAGDLTDLNSWRQNTSGRNWTADLYAVAEGSSATDSQAVAMAIRNAGVPAGAEILMTGHSQGGIIAANLAADPTFSSEYKVDGVVTYGSPIDCADIGANTTTPFLSTVHGNRFEITPTGIHAQVGDIVPQTDFGGGLIPAGGAGHITQIDLDPRGTAFIDITKNHQQDGYEVSEQHLSSSQQQQIATFASQAQLDKFYVNSTTGNTQGTTATVQISGAGQ